MQKASAGSRQGIADFVQKPTYVARKTIVNTTAIARLTGRIAQTAANCVLAAIATCGAGLPTDAGLVGTEIEQIFGEVTEAT